MSTGNRARGRCNDETATAAAPGGGVPVAEAAESRKRAGRLAGLAAAACALLVVSLGAISGAGATKPNPEHKISLCHRTASYKNPYRVLNVDVASVLSKGHDGHDGPVFSPSIPKHTKWGDVIPPFDYGPGRQYAGQNWNSAGMAIHQNGCRTIKPPTTTLPTASTTSTSFIDV